MILDHFLKVLTPDMVLMAIKDNPKLMPELVQKFDTFKLLGQALTTELQVVLSTNAGLVNNYLVTEDGKAAIKLWAEGFAEFVDLTKRKAEEEKAEQTRLSEIASKEQVFTSHISEKELKDKLRKEIREELLREMNIQDAVVKTK